MDARMGGSLLFYLTFALMAASLSTEEQKSALRIALSLGVVFCLNEISVLQDANKENGDRSYNSPVHFMPNHLCLFEKVRSPSFNGHV